MKKILTIFLALLLTLCSAAPVFAEDADRMQQIRQITAEVAEADKRSTQYNNQINQLNAQIQETQKKIDEAEAKRDKQEKELEERMRVMYMYGDEGYLEMMFSAKSLSDFISYFDLTRDIMTADKKAQTELVNTKKEIERAKQSLEESKASVEKAKADNDKVLNEKKAILQQNQDLVKQLEAQLGTTALTQAYTTTAVQGAAAGASVTGGALGWVWPLDSSAPNAFLITSLMGTRESPGGVGSTDHGGTDIAAAAGTPILAVESGTVTIAGGYGGYGNCVQISHGTLKDGATYETLYGHMSSIAVSVGQQVTKGQVIGYEGSTGWSTGAHLHFEVHQNGNKINGLSMYDQSILNKLSYALDA